MNAKKKQAKKAAGGFTAEEREAMKERVREMKGGADGEKDLLAKVAAMPEPDRSMARRLHEIVMAAAPSLAPKTWYGMPAWANADGKVVCFFQNASKFKYRYSTLGFSDQARLDEGAMWATSFALANLSPADAARITALVKKAAG